MLREALCTAVLTCVCVHCDPPCVPACALQPVGWPPIKAIIERELGRPISDVFVSIDPNPLASASVAQVGLDRS